MISDPHGVATPHSGAKLHSVAIPHSKATQISSPRVHGEATVFSVATLISWRFSEFLFHLAFFIFLELLAENLFFKLFDIFFNKN